MIVSVSSQGDLGDAPSWAPGLSANGRFVVFESDATNLVSGDTNGLREVFVHDRDVDADGIYDEPGFISTTRASMGFGGAQPNGASFSASITADGRFVAFASEASNLLAASVDTNGVTDVFVYDRTLSTTARVSVATSGSQGNDHSYKPAIANLGRFVTFTSAATNFEPTNNALADIFIRDMTTNTTLLASVDLAGGPANGASTAASISDNGRFTAFQSDATDLFSPDSGGFTDIFVRDRGVMLPGDFNGDHMVNAKDVDVLNQNMGVCECCATDLDHDGDVDAADRAILLANWTG